MTTEEIEIGQKIRNLRISGGYTQAQFAKAIGISTATLSSYENGKTCPPMHIVMKIALIFNTSTDYVLNLLSPEVNPWK